MKTPRLRDVDPVRSAQMALVRSKNTKPEMIVRSLVHFLGYRFRLHRRDLPGSPDLVFPRHRKVILVHGCFWHRHSEPSCWRSRLPKSRPEFWIPKLSANAARDQHDLAELEAAGWAALVIWECQTTPSTQETLKSTLRAFFAEI